MRHRKGYGLTLLALVLIMWLLSSFIMNGLFKTGDLLFDKPFAVTYINTASFSLYLIPLGIQALLRKRGKVYERLEQQPQSQPQPQQIEHEPPLTHRQTATVAFQFCILWFMANYASNAALAFTNVPSFTILSSMSGIFTLLSLRW